MKNTWVLPSVAFFMCFPLGVFVKRPKGRSVDSRKNGILHESKIGTGVKLF